MVAVESNPPATITARERGLILRFIATLLPRGDTRFQTPGLPSELEPGFHEPWAPLRVVARARRQFPFRIGRIEVIVDTRVVPPEKLRRAWQLAGGDEPE